MRILDFGNELELLTRLQLVENERSIPILEPRDVKRHEIA